MVRFLFVVAASSSGLECIASVPVEWMLALRERRPDGAGPWEIASKTFSRNSEGVGDGAREDIVSLWVRRGSVLGCSGRVPSLLGRSRMGFMSSDCSAGFS